MKSEVLFLSGDEVAVLTGYKQPRKQVLQLAEIGIPFSVNGADRPVVLKATVLECLGSKRLSPRGRARVGPDFSKV